MKTNFYAAHLKEGDFNSAEAALKSVGFNDADIAAILANAAINKSETIVAQIKDGDFAAVVTQRAGRFLLWQALVAPDFLVDTEDEARQIINQFEEKGITGTWGVFEHTFPARRTAH
jgi:sulfur carrier protein ThiS